MHASRAWRSLSAPMLGYAAAIAAGLLSLWVSGAWSAGFSGADEPAHFLNTYFVAMYERHALGTDPMAYAAEFYLHYPKLLIGHWPPAFYGLLSPLFLLFPATSQTAFAINLAVAALPAVAIALLLQRLAGRLAAVAGALLWAMTPVALEAHAFFMLDQALTAFVLAALILWLAFAEKQSWPRILGFALLTAFAILTKGNGWLLALVPGLHIALTMRWRLLASFKLYCGAALAILLVAPWYALTAGIAADGFNYRPGFAYAGEALLFNVAALADNLTWAGLLLAGYGALSEFRSRQEMPLRWSIAAGCLAVLVATLILQSLVPVDLDPRYTAPALPALVVLLVAGARDALAKLASGQGSPAATATAAAAAALLLWPGVSHLAAREQKVDFRLAEVASLAARAPLAEAWLIDGTSGAEGAFIAEMAVRDPKLKRYAVRGSKLLSESNFMGSDYRLRYRQPHAVVAELRRLGIAGLVLVRGGGAFPFPHSRLLQQALDSPGSGYRRVAVLEHGNRPGTTMIYRSAEPMRMNEAAIRALGLPDKVKGKLAPAPSNGGCLPLS